MRMDRMTSRLQGALADAQSLAAGRDHASLEPVHLLAVLIEPGARFAVAVAAAGRRPEREDRRRDRRGA